MVGSELGGSGNAPKLPPGRGGQATRESGVACRRRATLADLRQSQFVPGSRGLAPRTSGYACGPAVVSPAVTGPALPIPLGRSGRHSISWTLEGGCSDAECSNRRAPGAGVPGPGPVAGGTGGRPDRPLAGGIRPTAVADGGRYLTLEDGRTWEVDISDRATTGSWAAGDFLTLRRISAPRGDYEWLLLRRGDLDQQAAVRLVGPAAPPRDQYPVTGASGSARRECRTLPGSGLPLPLMLRPSAPPGFAFLALAAFLLAQPAVGCAALCLLQRHYGQHEMGGMGGSSASGRVACHTGVATPTTTPRSRPSRPWCRPTSTCSPRLPVAAVEPLDRFRPPPRRVTRTVDPPPPRLV